VRIVLSIAGAATPRFVERPEGVIHRPNCWRSAIREITPPAGICCLWHFSLKNRSGGVSPERGSIPTGRSPCRTGKDARISRFMLLAGVACGSDANRGRNCRCQIASTL